MLFSIIIPVKNRSPLLRRALESLRRQTFHDFEVLVIDDHSVEDLSITVRKFSDLNCRLLTSNGTGAPAARNFGAMHANAPYVAYLDSDDIFLPEKLTELAREISQSTENIFVSPLYVWRGNDNCQIRPSRAPMENEDISEFYFVSDQRMQSSSFVVATDLARNVRWNEKLRKVQDPDFMIRLIRSGGKLKYLEKPLAVLFDDTTQGRISGSDFSANMSEWLKDHNNPLTERARKGFKLYALSYEISKTNKMAAARIVLQNYAAVSPKIVAKTLVRILTPERWFKRLAQGVLIAQFKKEGESLKRYIDSLTD